MERPMTLPYSTANPSSYGKHQHKSYNSLTNQPAAIAAYLNQVLDSGYEKDRRIRLSALPLGFASRRRRLRLSCEKPLKLTEVRKIQGLKNG